MQQKFALPGQTEKRLVISWKAFWKDIVVSLDGQPVGGFADLNDLKKGKQFNLPDGTPVDIQMKGTLFPMLSAKTGETHLKGSNADPVAKWKNALILLYIIAGCTIVFGAVVEIFQIQILQEMGIGWISAGFGAVYLILALLSQKKIVVAMIIAVILYAADALLTLGYFAAQSSSTYNVSGMVVRIFIFLYLARGVSGLLEMKKQDQKTAP